MDLVETFQREWPVISQAPWSVATLIVAVTGLTWLFSRWMTNTQLATKQGRLDLANDRIADYERKLNVASPDEAKQRLDVLEQRLAAIEQGKLSLEQAKAISASISTSPLGVRITRGIDATDREALYRQLVAIFQEAGWAVQPSIVIRDTAPPESGLSLLVPPANPSHHGIDVIRAALRSAGLEFNERPNDNPEESLPQLLLSTPYQAARWG